MASRLTYLLTLTLVLSLAHGSVVSGADPDLVGWWRLDGSAVDNSGNGHDGVLFGSPEWVDGFIGGALAFDGVDDRVEMPTTSPAQGFPAVDGEVTWMLWFKTGASAAIKSLMTLGPAGAAHIQGNRSINVEVSGVIMMRAHSVGDLTSVSSVATVNDDEWHHVAVTIAFDADGVNDPMKAYIDGELDQGYEADNININLHKGPAADFIMTLGARGTTPFDGLMDDVRIYQRVLSADEVQLVMLSGGEPIPNAYGPKPGNGSMINEKSTLLEWVAGDFAVSHEVYFGETFDDVNDGLVAPMAATETSLRVGFVPPYPAGLTPGQTYYWRVDEVNDVHPDSPWKGDVWSFRVRPAKAWEPSPADGLLFVDPNQDLTWQAGLGNIFHTVYIRESFEEAQSATGSLMMTVEATFDPGLMDPGKTYYWRVDEFDGLGTHTGDVWSFTTAPAVELGDPSLLLWYTLDEGMGTNVIDWSGHGHHGTLFGPQWVPNGWFGDAALKLSGGYIAIQKLLYDTNDITEATVCTWIQTSSAGSQYIASFDRSDYWRLEINGNGAGPGQVGWDVMTSTGQVDYGSVTRVDDGQWHHVCGVFDNGVMTIYIDGQPEPPMTGGPVMGTGNPRFGFVCANSEATTFNGTRSGGAPVAGSLDDFRIYDKALTWEEIQAVMRPDPRLAWRPSPGAGATTDAMQVASVSWLAGDGAAEHDVYFGTDRAAVLAADADDATGLYRGRQTQTGYTPDPAVEWDQVYFWRVDEVAGDGTVTRGTLWSFTVTDFLIVEDFESYNDDIEAGTTIYQTWVDGFDNGTGSQVGYLTSANGTFGETGTTHGGGQSMPLHYQNSVAPGISETTRTFDPAEDWTRAGVTTLVVHFSGDLLNTGQLYLKINGTRVDYDGDPADLAATTWTAWTVDLASVGITPANVTTLTIGVEGGATGIVYVDDIQLTKPEVQAGE